MDEPPNVSERILIQIRDEMRGMRGDIHEMRGDIHEMRGDIQGLRSDVDRLERHAATANELLGLMHERLVFMERSAKVATDSRMGLDDRVTRLEQRVDALEDDDPS